jgi:hypothetical protein
VVVVCFANVNIVRSGLVNAVEKARIIVLFAAGFIAPRRVGQGFGDDGIAQKVSTRITTATDRYRRGRRKWCGYCLAYLQPFREPTIQITYFACQFEFDRVAVFRIACLLLVVVYVQKGLTVLHRLTPELVKIKFFLILFYIHLRFVVDKWSKSLLVACNKTHQSQSSFLKT